jgi:hypothetical protein
MTNRLIIKMELGLCIQTFVFFFFSLTAQRDDWTRLSIPNNLTGFYYMYLARRCMLKFVGKIQLSFVQPRRHL